MIQIQSVRVSGFRGLSNIEVNLEKTTVLIGMNNAGKTSFLKALQIAFGDTRFVNEDDFYIDTSEIQVDDIIIDVLLIPLDDTGNRAAVLDRYWASVFRGSVQLDGDGNEYVAFRTKISRIDDQRRFYPQRVPIKEWVNFESWKSGHHVGTTKMSSFSDSISFLFQDAQRDITEDLKLRTSPLGRVLSKVEYEPGDIAALQELIDELNQDAVDKSDVLTSLRTHLSELGDAIGTQTGKTEITPFAKKIRDLTKGMRLNYGEGDNSFSMEYHGMGTRSWASLLVIRSYAKILEAERRTNNKPFLAILALEEPEAHLHPNAQKQLYHQMSQFPGQVIISTHSPYVAAQANIGELRSFYKTNNMTKIGAFNKSLAPDSKRKIQREIIERQGDILFARIIVLQEGQTESQLLPRLIEACTDKSCFRMGVSTIQVGSYANYESFLAVASALNIPVIIYSDTDDDHVKQVVRNAVLALYPALTGPSNDTVFMDEGNNLEKQLITEGFQQEVKESFVRYHSQINPDERYVQVLRNKYAAYSDDTLLAEMTQKKTIYSHFLGDIFIENPFNREESKRFPRSVVSLCRKIETWKSQ